LRLPIIGIARTKTGPGIDWAAVLGIVVARQGVERAGDSTEWCERSGGSIRSLRSSAFT